MSNSRRCAGCGNPHWQSGKYCIDCTHKAARPVTQRLLDMHDPGNRVREDEFYERDGEKKIVKRGAR